LVGADLNTLAWIVAAGLAMAAIALVGSVTLVLPEPALRRLLLPLVGLAAGSLLGGAFFHMLPEAVSRSGGNLDIWVAFVAGFLAFFVLEQFLHWHHCHQPVSRHRPLGYLILLADGVHNFIGGLAVGSAFVIDIELGLVTWLVAAAHEVPQELGDFGILVHSGWRRRPALVYNFLSGLTFLIGALVALAVSGAVDVALLLPFAAGNFAYIAASDLIPQLRATGLGRQLEYFAALLGGLVVLWLAAL
jgi:zinc and cadmium transporter